MIQRYSSFPLLRLLSLLCLLLAGLLIEGCTTTKRLNDAVRIRPEREGAYQRAPSVQETRDGRTLRGTVREVVILPRKDDPTQADTFLLFLDARAEDKRENYERIPLQDVERIADLLSLPADTLYGNINVVESFNNTERIPELRRVPIRDYSPRGTESPSGGGGGNDCQCQPLDLSFSFPELECPQRVYPWFFAELRGVYSAFTDIPRQGTQQGREAYLGEIAAGARFGESNEWGVGAAYSTGTSVFNSFKGTSSQRPMVLLHLRYQTPGPISNILGICMKPFIYGQFGAAIDDASINLMKFNLNPEGECGECGEIITRLEAEGSLPQVDFSLPLTFGIGIGIDIPAFSFMDISTDIGFRSIGIGEEAALAGFSNVPSLRRINTFFLRAGVTF